jgi:hypothetical protein
MKCSAVASVSISSALKNSSWPLRPLRPASTRWRPAGDQKMALADLPLNVARCLSLLPPPSRIV